MEKFCTQCGAKMTTGMSFCTQCGAALSAPGEQASPVQQQPAAAAPETKLPAWKPGRRKQKVDPVFILIVFLFIAGCTALGLYPFLKTRYPAITGQFDKLRGVYTGPAFIAPPAMPIPVISDKKTVFDAAFTKAGTMFYFKPAAAKKYRITAVPTEPEYIDLIVKNNPADQEALASNKQTSSAKRGMTLDELKKGNQFEFRVQANADYYVLVYAGSETAYGKKFTLSVTLINDELKLETIFAGFVVALFIIYLIRILHLIRKWKRSNRS